MTLQTFITMWTGRHIDEDGAYGAQCWDLIQKYAKEVVGCPNVPTGGNLGVFNIFTRFQAPLSQFFDRVDNNPSNPNQVPPPGAIVVWGAPYGIVNGEMFGHAAIVLQADPGSSSMLVLQQNSPVGSPPVQAHMPYNGLLGWLVPKKNVLADPEPAPAPPTPRSTAPMPAGEFYTMQSGDNPSMLESAWGLPQGTLMSMNPGLNARQIPVGYGLRIRQPAAAEPQPAAPVDRYSLLVSVPGYVTSNDAANRINSNSQVPAGDYDVFNRYNGMINVTRISGQPGWWINPGDNQPAPQPAAQEAPVLDTTPAANAVTAPEPVLPAAVQSVKPPIPQVGTGYAFVAPPSFWSKHFNSRKILADLAAVGTVAAAAIAWIDNNHAAVSFALSTLGGIIFGGNRLNKK